MNINLTSSHFISKHNSLAPSYPQTMDQLGPSQVGVDQGSGDPDFSQTEPQEHILRLCLHEQRYHLAWFVALAFEVPRNTVAKFVTLQ